MFWINFDKDVINDLKPDYVVHGDDWKEGVQKPIRDEVIELLKSYGGELVEFPYSHNEEYEKLELVVYAKLAFSLTFWNSFDVAVPPKIALYNIPIYLNFLFSISSLFASTSYPITIFP